MSSVFICSQFLHVFIHGIVVCIVCKVFIDVCMYIELKKVQTETYKQLKGIFSSLKVSV